MQSKLQLLLLRAGTVVAEADGRGITNGGMLLQLKQLREAMYRGYYVLDGSSSAWQQTSSTPKGAVPTRQGKLRREMENLEAMLDGMKGFLSILMHCPPIVRQPHSAYMFMERCMLGRHAEKEQITRFLLHHPTSSSCLQVLPLVGPCYVGKTTLVEHVCMDEAVRANFSCVLRLRGEDLSNLAAVADGDSDNENRRRKLLLLSNGRCLITVELAHEEDVAAWGKLYSFLRRGAHGSNSKVILTSRMEKVSSLGTVEVVRMTRLRREEYWYFFRVLAFGSANPYDHHPDLASIGNEIAMEIDGYFLMANILTRMLRGNMSTHFWRRTLWWIRKSMRASSCPRLRRGGPKAPTFQDTKPFLFPHVSP
jgi:hypothetical protein